MASFEGGGSLRVASTGYKRQLGESYPLNKAFDSGVTSFYATAGAPAVGLYSHKPPTDISAPSALDPLREHPSRKVLKSCAPADCQLGVKSNAVDRTVPGLSQDHRARLGRLAALPQSERGLHEAYGVGAEASLLEPSNRSWGTQLAASAIDIPLPLRGDRVGSMCSPHVLVRCAQIKCSTAGPVLPDARGRGHQFQSSDGSRSSAGIMPCTTARALQGYSAASKTDERSQVTPMAMLDQCSI